MTTDASERQENEGKKFVETSEGEIAVRTLNFGSLVPTAYDYIALTYVASGQGVGEIETVTYKINGSTGTTVAILTLGYDISNKLSSVTKI